MTISAKMVKDLREKTGAGMMACKKALTEVNGDFEAAVDFLRTKGLAAAAKKADRVAAEGLVAVAVNGTKAAAVEVNSETDFVARNEKFQAMVLEIAKHAVYNAELEALKQAKTANGKSVEEAITENIATIGENMNLRRATNVEVTSGGVFSYMHNAVADNLGKIAVLVALESSLPAEKLESLGKQLAMHIAAARPEALTTAEVDQENLERERAIYAEQAKESGKPDNIIEKMVEGRIRKYYEQVVLLEQTYVIDNETKIKDVVKNAAKELGAEIELKSFVRYELGQGVEKQESDFAAEVAAAAGS